MKQVTVLALLLVSGFCNAAQTSDPFADETALAWASRYVLVMTSTDSQRLPVAAGIAEHSQLRTPAMLDLLAEVLHEIHTQKLPAKRTGFQIVRILIGVPNAARYFDVIDSIDRYINETGAYQVIDTFKFNNRRSGVEQYVPGTIDLTAMRQQLLRTAIETQPTVAQAQALADMPTNATMDDLFRLAGKPALVVGREATTAHASAEVRQIHFYYRGIGRVTYDFQRDIGWFQRMFVADPMAFESLMPYRSQAAALGMPDAAALATIQLLSGNAASIKISAQEVYGWDEAPRDYLDAAAEMLLQHYVEVANTGATDAYSWLCNVLTHHGGPRYANVLQTIQQHSSDAKLTKYAGKSIETRAGMISTPYVPGSVSLDDMAKKYPRLYPQITLIRGLL